MVHSRAILLNMTHSSS